MVKPDIVERLLAAFADLGQQDLYTDAEEYWYRVNAMQELAGLAQFLVDGHSSVTLEDIQQIWDGAARDNTEE